MKTAWTAADIPDQRNRVAVITGANTGLGFHTAAALADRGALVVLAVRDTQKGRAAAAEISRMSPHADVEVLELDLTSLDSIHLAASQLTATHPAIDLLINNAGVMWTPQLFTSDGFELQFGTNHLGHYAFTGLILKNLLTVSDSRVVTISSLAHRQRSDIDFDDLHSRESYDRVAAYGRSKLANLLFTYELQRRLTAAGAPTIAVAAHPGMSGTELMRSFPVWMRLSIALAGPVLLQPADKAALTTLRAATDPSVRGGEYYGPDGHGERRGNPVAVASSRRSHDEALQAQMWEASMHLTSVEYPL